jgi:hypothetical protein
VSKLAEGFIIINIIGCGLFAVGTAIGLLWFRLMGDPLDKNTIWLIAKIFFAVWVGMNIFYLIAR